MHRLKRKQSNISYLLGVLGGVLLAICLGFVLTSGVSATYTPLKTTTYVEIDGVDYGTFDHINDLRDLTSHKKQSQETFTRVVLKRDFVTDPSLYYWARNSFQNQGGLTDINLVMRTSDGEEVSRYTLKSCKPLSFTVEAADPDLGGFHEKIDLVVQEIAIY